MRLLTYKGLAGPHSRVTRGLLCVVCHLSLKLPAVGLQAGKGFARNSRTILGVGSPLLADCNLQNTQTKHEAQETNHTFFGCQWTEVHRLSKLSQAGST